MLWQIVQTGDFQHFCKSHWSGPALVKYKTTKLHRKIAMILERITHFKAAELKNFLLFYSFSCLIGILPQDQFYHFSLLVYAPFFFRKKITAQDIHQCKRMMMEYVIHTSSVWWQILNFECPSITSYYRQCCRSRSPLVHIMLLFWGLLSPAPTLVSWDSKYTGNRLRCSVCVHQSIPKMAQTLHYGSCEQEFFKRMIDNTRKCLSLVPIIAGRCEQGEQHAVFLLGGDLHIMTFFKRPYAHQQIVHCLQYKSAFRRDNSVARFSGHGFGRVHYFVKLNTLRSCGPSFYALVKVMERSSERSDDIPRSSSERHMVALRPSCGQLIAVNVKDITDVCVCVCV